MGYTISKVMKDVYSQRGRIDFWKTRYKVITEEKVTSTVRESLKNKLIIIPVEQSQIEIWNRCKKQTNANHSCKIIDTETGKAK